MARHILTYKKIRKLLALKLSVVPTVFTGIVLLSLVSYAATASTTRHTPAPKPVATKKTAEAPSSTQNSKPAATSPPPATPKPSAPVTKSKKRLAAAPAPAPIVTPAPSSSVDSLKPATTPETSPTSPDTTSPSAPDTGTQAPSQQVSYTSTNWSGYLAANGTYTAVSGSWTATSPTSTSATQISADSTWIGIGGVTSGDLIQVGTQNLVNPDGSVDSEAFYEMLPDFSQPVPGVTVTPGDSMSASITQISAGQWTISITDNTSGQSYTHQFAYASSNSSVEWVEEDPSYGDGSLVPFDDFDTATFTQGLATVDGNSVNILGANSSPITLVSRSGRARATPSALVPSGSGFTVTRN